MTFSLFLIQVAILFLPGVIWAHLDNKYASKRDDSQLWFLLRALLFGLVSHSVVWVIYQTLGWKYILVDLGAAATESIITDKVAGQVFAATAIGLILAIAWMYFVNFKLLTRFLQKIKATKTYGDEDVWDYILNSHDAAAEYVHVRDFERRIVYAGWVSVFSESGKLRELILRDVQVYDFDGELMFETPRVYVARKPEGTHIEFPYVEKTESEGDQNAEPPK